ncbi:MAG: hypothetical protein HOM69_13955 [Gammaproteobacteria bacterium]|nr:hypothetical protein [Gammaproteobacteria bacterium]MBT5054324.1 hypothetical protein [Gammaproteobacteria bacterium]
MPTLKGFSMGLVFGEILQAARCRAGRWHKVSYPFYQLTLQHQQFLT